MGKTKDSDFNEVDNTSVPFELVQSGTEILFVAWTRGDQSTQFFEHDGWVWRNVKLVTNEAAG